MIFKVPGNLFGSPSTSPTSSVFSLTVDERPETPTAVLRAGPSILRSRSSKTLRRLYKGPAPDTPPPIPVLALEPRAASLPRRRLRASSSSMLTLAEFLRTTGPEEVDRPSKARIPLPKVTPPPPKLLESPVSPLGAVHDANAALQDIVSAMLKRSESENSLDILSQFSSPSTAPSLSPEVHAAGFLDTVNWTYLSSSPITSGDGLHIRSKRIVWDSSSLPAVTKPGQPDLKLKIDVENFEKEVATAFRLPQTPQPTPVAQFRTLQPPPSTPDQRPRTADHTTLLALSTRRKQAGDPITRPGSASSPPRERTWRHGTVIAKNIMSTDELGRPKLDDELNRVACTNYI